MTNEYDLLIVNDNKIDFMPRDLIHEILQNVITICTTMKGSVPMDREFGVNPMLIDEPVNVARAKIASEIVEAVRKYEPRARVSEVTFEGDSDGKIQPHVKVKIVL